MVETFRRESITPPHITIAIGPHTTPTRGQYLDHQLFLEGLSHIQEDPNAAYCAISLTSTPEPLKEDLAERQFTTMEILEQAGITAYDPASAPFSPDRGLTAGPDRVYIEDIGKIVGARFFVAHDLLPSTGVGVEMRTANQLNRIPVVLHDKKIRTSRMQTNRTIHLAYDNLTIQANELVEVFKFLKQFEPGMGFHESRPALLGFSQDGNVVNLAQEVYDRFPDLKYEYDGMKPIVQLSPLNIQLFKENIQ